MDMKDLTIGEKETKKGLGIAKVTVVRAEIEKRALKTGEKETLVLFCKHPESQQEVKISKAKIEKDGQLTTQGLWITLDSKGKLSYNSTIAVLLRFYQLSELPELIGEQLETTYESKEKQFLCIKAYE